MASSAGANRPVGANDQKSEEPPPRDEPYVEPVDGVVQPPVVPPPHRPGRLTNQLQYILKNVFKPVFQHQHSWPFHQPVNAIKLNLPVSIVSYLDFVVNFISMARSQKELTTQCFQQK